MRTFVFQDGGSHKFWNIELKGTGFTVTFGKVGAKGQTKEKTFADATAAKLAHDKLVAEKVGKGYAETTAAGSVTSAPTRTPHALQVPLEAALVENPDEATAHAAYADYLVEEGDPRGEFMQVQLALEDETRAPAERKKLQKRERELLAAHGGEWLGDLGRFLVGDWSGEDKPYHVAFRRGWLDYVRTLPEPEAITDVLAEAPEARLLRRLDIVYDMRYHPFDFDQFTAGPNAALGDGEGKGAVYDGMSPLPELIRSTVLTNLRAFKIGFSDDREPFEHSTMVDPFGGLGAQDVIELLTKCPRLDELYLNTDVNDSSLLFGSPLLNRVRVFQYYFGTDYVRYDQPGPGAYPLSILANNPAAANLTTLRFHPGRDTTLDLGEVRALLESKHLPRLEHLQLHMTTYGDEICAPLIASGIMKRLKTLDLGYGNMTDEGARQLAACADTKHLEVLNLSRNALTPAGVAALRKAGVRAVADEQHAADDEYPEYLSVDVE